MVQHIDMALDLLQKNSMKNGKAEENKYDAMIDVFIYNKTFEESAEKYHCTPLTVRRWKNDMLKSLGILLFGIDGLLNRYHSRPNRISFIEQDVHRKGMPTAL